MSLRLRLTLLYSTLTGGVLLVFAAAVIYVFNALLFNQIDNTLESSANIIIRGIKMDMLGRAQPDLSSADINSDVYVQVWGLNNEIQSSPQKLEDFSNKPFDPSGLRSASPVYREINDGKNHLRVFTIPLEQNGHTIWVMQLATDLSNVDSARNGLTNILSILLVVAVLFTGNVAWFTLGQTLKPLSAITDAAEQINRADDLSRRIPYSGPEHDEIGNLVGSFNQTLERLEALFTSQQRLLADVSHELRTPLTVIKGNVDLMRRMKVLDDESLTSIDQEAGRLTRLVGGLLMLAQAESGRLTLNIKMVELDLLLTEVFQEMSVLARNKVHVHLNDIDQCHVNGDRDRLKQVLINLRRTRSSIRHRAGMYSSALKRSVSRHASFVGTPDRASLPRTCLTSLSVSIVLRNPARVERPPDLGWVFPSRIGSSNIMGDELKWSRRKARAQPLPFGCHF